MLILTDSDCLGVNLNKFGKRVITIDQGRIVNDSVGGYVGGHIHG